MRDHEEYSPATRDISRAGTRLLKNARNAVSLGGAAADTMKALVYGGPGLRAWQTKPKAVVRDPGDAVVRITTSTIEESRW